MDERELTAASSTVFSATKSGRGDVLARIEKGLTSKLGLTVHVIPLTAREVAAALRKNPLSDVATNPSQLLIVVPRKRSDLASLRPLTERPWAPETLALDDRVAYLWCAKGVADSMLWPAVERVQSRCDSEELRYHVEAHEPDRMIMFIMSSGAMCGAACSRIQRTGSSLHSPPTAEPVRC